MKRRWTIPLLIALPACTGDDSTPTGPGVDASLSDVTTTDTGGDDGSEPDTGTASSDASSDAADTGPGPDASDAGCPTSWYVAPVVDPSIAVPDGGGGVLLHAVGTGTQDYVCKATNNDAGPAYVWALVTPDATLSDCHSAVIGHHFASEAGPGFPEWKVTDGTYVIGQKPPGSFTPDGGAGSIPWLLVHAVGASDGGVISRTQFIQRLDTDGGLAPSTPCDSGSVGTTANIPYSADYYFFGQ